MQIGCKLNRTASKTEWKHNRHSMAMDQELFHKQFMLSICVYAQNYCLYNNDTISNFFGQKLSWVHNQSLPQVCLNNISQWPTEIKAVWQLTESSNTNIIHTVHKLYFNVYCTDEHKRYVDLSITQMIIDACKLGKEKHHQALSASFDVCTNVAINIWMFNVFEFPSSIIGYSSLSWMFKYSSSHDRLGHKVAWIAHGTRAFLARGSITYVYIQAYGHKRCRTFILFRLGSALAFGVTMYGSVCTCRSSSVGLHDAWHAIWIRSSSGKHVDFLN